MQTPLAAAAPQESQTSSGNKVVADIRAAADSTGVPFDFLLAQATRESSLDPDARNRRSSAAGLFQFTRSTWLDMVKRHGAKYGLDHMAAAITKDGKGRWQVEDPAARQAILDLRQDSRVSALMAGEYAKTNARTLESRLGRPASSHDLYLAHFLGAAGAARVLEGMATQPKSSAAAALPEAAQANPEIFREPGSRRSRSLASLYKTVQGHFDRALGDSRPLARQELADVSRLDLAAIRPQSRPAAELPQAEPPLQLAAAPPPMPVQSQALANDKAATTANAPLSFPMPPPLGSAARADAQTLRWLLNAQAYGGKA